MGDDDIRIEWMAECSVDCAICGRYAGSAAHICDFAGIGVEQTCANICPSCIAALAALVPRHDSAVVALRSAPPEP